MGDGDASVKHLDPATALSIAGQWRDEFAEQGYLTTDQIRAGLEQATEEYIVIAAGAVNNDGVIDRDEYTALHEILPYYDPILENWQLQSPLLARLDFLDGQATRECGNDNGCREKKEEARRGILQGDWDGIRFLNAGGRDAAVKTLLPWLNDPEVRLHYTPLLESALYVSDLEAAVEPLIFNADEDIRRGVIGFKRPFHNTRLISLARQRLEENPRDQHAFLALVSGLQFGTYDEPDNQRQLQKLTEKYMRESEMHPEDAFPHWALGHLLEENPDPERRGDRERIKASFAKAAELEPANPRYQFDAGAGAVEPLEEAVELDLGNVSYLERLARAYLGKNRHDEAIRNMLAVADIRPERNLELGYFYLRAGQYDKAVEAFKKYLGFYPDGYHEVLKECLSRVEDIPPSFLSLLEQSLLRLGATREACYLLARVHQELKDFEKAEKYYRLALQCPESSYLGDDSDSEIYKALGDVLREQGNNEAAVDAYRKAIELNPSAKPKDYHEFGSFLYSLGRYDEAIEQLKKAVEIDERDFLDWRDECRARGYDPPGRKSQVDGGYLFDLVKAYRASGHHPQEVIDCFVRAGDVLFAEGDYRQAEQYYRYAVKDRRPWILWHKAGERLKFEDIGDVDGVFAAIRIMDGRIPGDKRYHKADLGIIRSFRAQGLLDEALEHTERCLREYTGDIKQMFQLEYDALTREKRDSN